MPVRLYVAYRGGIDPTRDRALVRLVGEEPSATGLGFGRRDLEWDPPSEAVAYAVREKLLKHDPSLEVFVEGEEDEDAA